MVLSYTTNNFLVKNAHSYIENPVFSLKGGILNTSECKDRGRKNETLPKLAINEKSTFLSYPHETL